MALDSPETVALLLWMTVGPVVFFAGVFGNVIILIVLRRGATLGHHGNTTLYVTLIAVADLVVLLTGMVNEWLKYERLVNLEDLHPLSCKLIKVLVYVSMDVAIWLVALFTAERFLAVCLPFRYKNTALCQTRSVYSYVLLCVVAGLVLNGATLFTRGAEFVTIHQQQVLVSNCGYTSPRARHYELHVKPWLVFTFATALPIVILIACNSLVLHRLHRFRRRSLQRSISSASETRDSERLLRHVTCMCVGVSFAFVLFVTPSVILLIGKVHWQECPSYVVMKAINNLLVYCNHSINCYLYLVIGRSFRSHD